MCELGFRNAYKDRRTTRTCLSPQTNLRDKDLTSASGVLAVVRSFSSSVCMEFSCCNLSFSWNSAMPALELLLYRSDMQTQGTENITCNIKNWWLLSFLGIFCPTMVFGSLKYHEYHVNNADISEKHYYHLTSLYHHSRLWRKNLPATKDMFKNFWQLPDKKNKQKNSINPEWISPV